MSEWKLYLDEASSWYFVGDLELECKGGVCSNLLGRHLKGLLCNHTRGNPDENHHFIALVENGLARVEYLYYEASQRLTVRGILEFAELVHEEAWWCADRDVELYHVGNGIESAIGDGLC